MITESNQIFRITYEAFSKFSNNLNRCRTFSEIEECFTVNLKYLFNYHVFRASYHRGNTFVHLDSIKGKTIASVDKIATYLEHEKLLLEKKIPLKWNNLQALNLPECFVSVEEESPELWGWNFTNDNRQIIITVLAGSRKNFSWKDITFLKLVAENLETKLLELCLIKELDEKNKMISVINKHQKEIIKQRTLEIAGKNKTLIEISVLNAHNVREPLSRIIGLVNLLGSEFTDESLNEIVPLIKTSSKDLDRALQNVINHATNDLLELQA